MGGVTARKATSFKKWAPSQPITGVKAITGTAMCTSDISSDAEYATEQDTK